MLDGMGEVEDANGLGTEQIAEVLQPVCPIHHRTHHAGRLGSGSMDGQGGQSLEGLGITEPREVADVAGMGLAALLVQGADRHRPHFRPFTIHEWHHRPISTDLLPGWPLRAGWCLHFQLNQGAILVCDFHRACSFRDPPHRFGRDRDAAEELDERWYLMERQMRAQPGDGFDQVGRVVPRQQIKPLIQGEKDPARSGGRCGSRGRG